MKREIFSVILFVLLMTIAYIVIRIFTEKDASAGMFIAMIITFAVTRAVLFIIFRKIEK